jgi:hypothetical protein
MAIWDPQAARITALSLSVLPGESETASFEMEELLQAWLDS